MREKPVIVPRHARRRLRWRDVSREEVIAVVTSPDRTAPSIKERTNAFKALGGRFLRVSYKEEADAILIVTVTVRKKPFQEGT